MRECFFNDLAGAQMDIPFRASGPLSPAPEADPIAPGNRPPPPSPQPPEPEQEQSVHVPSEEIEDELVAEFFTPPETSPLSMAQAQAQAQGNVGQELPISTPEITLTQPSQSDSDAMSHIYNILVRNRYQRPMPVPAPAFPPLSSLPQQGGQPVLGDPPSMAYPVRSPVYVPVLRDAGWIRPSPVPDYTSAPLLPQSRPNWEDLHGRISGETAQAGAQRMAVLEARRERRRLYLERRGRLRQQRQQQQQAGTKSQIPSDGPSEIPRARYRLDGSSSVQSGEAEGGDRVEQSDTPASDSWPLPGPFRGLDYAFPCPEGY